MRFIFRLLLVLVIVVSLILGIAVVMAVDDHALVPASDAPSTADVARAKQLLARYDPRKLKAGAVNNAEIGASDLNLLAKHAINLLARGGATVEVGRGSLKGQASIELPDNPVGRYLNVEADLQAADGLPEFQRLRVGSITVPGWLANFAAVKALDAYMDGRGAGLVSEFIRTVEFEPGKLRLAYRWPAGAVEQVRARVVSPQADERLREFNERLVQVTRKFRHDNVVPLLEIMKPLFDLAETRSREGEPAADNLAAILILSAYVNGRSIEAIVPEASNWPEPTRLRVTLHRRRDLAQHYLTSAGLAAMGSGALSDAVGLFKEVEDSRGGSGFSFTDLAADRAGTRFGELATASSTSARTVQQRIAHAQRETDIMPKVGDLPEGMSEPEFKQRYGGIDSPAYRGVSQDIERRIDKTPLFR
jgi:hypothetical protein